MSGRPKNDRPPVVEAMQWVHRITAVSIEMVAPAVLGWWLDEKWGTEPWLVCIGAVIGFAISMKHLLQIAAQDDKKQDSKDDDPASKD